MSDVTSFDGTRLALSTWGRPGTPIVVLVHGLGLSSDSWGKVPELLAAEHRVVAYDLRGHAQSGDARGGDYSMAAHAKDLDAVLREVVPADSAAVVVGNSLGGGIVVARAHHCGNERVAGAVFAGSGGSTVTFPGFPARGLPAGELLRLEDEGHMLPLTRPELVAEQAARWVERVRPATAPADG